MGGGSRPQLRPRFLRRALADGLARALADGKKDTLPLLPLLPLSLFHSSPHSPSSTLPPRASPSPTPPPLSCSL